MCYQWVIKCQTLCNTSLPKNNYNLLIGNVMSQKVLVHLWMIAVRLDLSRCVESDDNLFLSGWVNYSTEYT